MKTRFRRSRARILFTLLLGSTALGLVASCHDECVAGRTYCNGGCPDVRLDSENCGGCGIVCTLGESCFDGKCAAVGVVADAGDGGTVSESTACAQCIRPNLSGGTPCESKLVNCKANPTCDAWAICANSCFFTSFTEPCFAACDAMLAGTGDVPNSLSQAVSDCVCAACGPTCTAMCPQ